MNHLPSLRQLQYLVALADAGSFSQAAEICHVTQSTLSAGIAALETLLNQQLVDRTRRQITLTATGAALIDSARQILIDAADLVDHAHQLQAPLSGPLRLGIIPTIAPYLLPHLLPFMKKSFPDIELQLYEDLSARLVKNLHNGDLDLLLLAFPYDTPGLTQHILFDENFVLACPKGARTSKAPVTHNELETMRLLLLEEGHCLRDHALAACRIQPATDHKTFSATSLPTLIQMVRHGHGATLLPETAVIGGQRPAGIDIFRFSDPAPKRTIGLAWRDKTPREADFKILARELAQPPP